jgi:hypothetical protein
VEPDPNVPGQIYRLWDVKTGQDLGTVGRTDKTILPNVVYLSQRDLVTEIVFPIKPYIDSSYTLFDLTSRRETATIEVKRGEGFVTQLCFSPDGRILAYSKWWGHNAELRLVEVSTGRVLAHLRWKTAVWASGVSAHTGTDLHWVTIVLTKRSVLLFGIGSQYAYVEAFNTEDGKNVIRFNTHHCGAPGD